MSVNSTRADSAQNLPTIAGIEITTDEFGRFNLNALHRASNEGEHKRPSKWLATQQAQELVAELESQTRNSRFETQSPISGFAPINAVHGGKTPGTFAAEELAVSYAGWISPKFQLEVNRVFIAYRKGELPAPDKSTSALPPREIRLQIAAYRRLYKDMGLEGRELVLAVVKAVKQATGFELAITDKPGSSRAQDRARLRKDATEIASMVSIVPPEGLLLAASFARASNAMPLAEYYEACARNRVHPALAAARKKKQQRCEMTLSPHIASLRDMAMRTSCEAWAIRCRWKLAPGIDRAGACPLCGGRDRFAIHTRKNTFHCRKCDLSGQGVISLVMATQKLDFVAACELITGQSAEAGIDPAAARRASEQARAEEQKRQREQQNYREKARRTGFDIWKQSAPFVQLRAGSVVAGYLRRRGLDPDRFLELGISMVHEIAAHAYHHRVDGKWQTILTGPALILPICRADGTFGAVHQTWLDLAQPKGKADLGALDGKILPVKKVLGSKKGGAIRIFTPPNPRRLVMGEGFETTATPLIHAFDKDTAYWAGVDLGNMAGRAVRDADGRQVMDQPDMSDMEAFVPPEWCEELVFLADPEGAGTRVQEKLTRGARRAMRRRRGLKAWIAPAPSETEDYNDLAMQMTASGRVGA